MTIRTYQCLTVLDIFLSEEELSVKIRQVDGIEVEERNVPEACEHDILHCSVSVDQPQGHSSQISLGNAQTE